MGAAMTAELVLSGIVIGLAVAAPIGPINLMCIQRSLNHGFLAGLATGAGAVLGDGVFAALSAFGLTAVSGVIQSWSGWIEALGGLLLLVMGVRVFLQSPPSARDHSPPPGLVRHAGLFSGTFALTITNPATMLGFIALFGAGGLVRSPSDYGSAVVIVLSVMLGSLLWWIIISAAVSRYRDRFSSRTMRRIDHFSGLLILGFGLFVLIRLAGRLIG
ncbi:MAG: lysine transporter LysE [Hyphomicrobiales bacterium]|nr:MAG: lysine transporter LysE [Hyphomicrobiales bacterium]